MEHAEKVRERQQDIVDGLVYCETDIAGLYEAYARAFPELRDFWTRLSLQERVHAKVLQGLHRILEKGYIFQNIGRFGSEGTRSIVDFVREKLQQVSRESSKTALLNAVRIESSLLDAHFYDVVESDAPEFREIAKRLSEETRAHVERIQRTVGEFLGHDEKNQDR